METRLPRLTAPPLAGGVREGISVRRAAVEDALAIAGLIRQAWASRVAADSSGHRETADKVRADLEKGLGWVALEGEKIVATVRMTPHPAQAGVCEIKKLAVLPEYRKQGIGPRLLELLEREAKAQGIREIRLGVRHDQPRLVEWYASLGYVHDPALGYSSPNPLTPPPFVLYKEVTT